MKRTSALVGCLLLATAGSAQAKVLYVNALRGNDAVTYAGNSATTPWATIGRASWGSASRSSPNPGEAARAGDVVSIAAGIYTYGGVVDDRFIPVYNPVNEGASGNPIVFLADGTVDLRAPNTASPVIGACSRDYVEWRGPFLLDEANILIHPDTGTVVFQDTTGSGIDGATIDGNGTPNYGYADNHNGVRVEGTQRCFVRNCVIHDVNMGTHHNGAGVMIYNSDDLIVEHNEIHNVGSGVYIKGVHTVSDYQSRTIVRFNKIHDADAVGVLFSDTEGSRVYQNIIYNCRFGVELLARLPGAYYHPVNDIFANNTIHNSSMACFFIKGTVHENVRVWNNICSATSDVFYIENNDMPAESAIDVEHQVYYSYGTFAEDMSGSYTFATWKSKYRNDQAVPASVDANPLFVNAAGLDFRLQAASPARSVGVDIVDLNGNGSTTDVIQGGAYVTGAEVIGPRVGGGSGLPPAAPAAVRIIR